VNPWTPVHALLFSVSFKAKNTKHIYFLAYNYKTQIYLSHIIFTLLHCYLLYLYYHILFYLYLHLVLDNHSLELGTQDKEVVLQVAWRTTRAFSSVIWEFDIKPRVFLWGKLFLVQYSAFRVPTSWAPLLSVIIRSRVDRGHDYPLKSCFMFLNRSVLFPYLFICISGPKSISRKVKTCKWRK
jgi:hypothetical protein